MVRTPVIKKICDTALADRVYDVGEFPGVLDPKIIAV
jgi:hypothetical protein